MLSTAGIASMSLSGHQMVMAGDLWVSRAPFTNADWTSNADRLWTDGRAFGILEARVEGDRLTYTLTYHSSVADLQERFGVGRVTDECGSWGNNDSKLFAASYRDVRPDFCNDYTGFLAAAPVQDSR